VTARGGTPDLRAASPCEAGPLDQAFLDSQPLPDSQALLDSQPLLDAQPLLDEIAGPADLRRLSGEQLARLAAEIRHFIVQSVSVTGGHMGSNLGVVELTLAIHRVFDSPNDVILWDTGHQAYVHKIVTGRRERFGDLRQEGGLSGYPSRAESEHDWVENSHASTILSYAHGIATALDLRGHHDRRVVAVVGDGSMTGGMAYEALNNLGHSGRRVLIVLNDNRRSYAPTIGGLAAGLTRIRLAPGYVEHRDRVQRLVQALPGVGRHLRRGMEGVRAGLREVVQEAAGFFEALGVRYIGPVDGHDLATLERVLAQSSDHDGPVVVHVLTQKGRGYRPAEDDDEKCLHDVPVFDPATGPPRWAPVGYTQAFADAMVDAGERDPRVVAITAAMGGPTGLSPFQQRWPERFLDVGIAEQHAVTAAAGLAMAGMRPVVAVYSTFLTRALDQVNLDVGLHRLPVVFCIDRAGITGDDGPSHHGVLDLALLSRVPGMTILAPSSAQELRAMLDHALRTDAGPVAIRYPKGPARQVPPDVVGSDVVGSGVAARRLVQGHDVCILAVGALVEPALEAARLLAREGLSTTVWDVRAVKPLDPAMLADAADHDLVVTVEDGIAHGGAGTAAADALAARPVPVLVLGVPDRHLAHGDRSRMLTALGLDGPGIAAAALSARAGRPAQEHAVAVAARPLDSRRSPSQATVRRDAGGAAVGSEVQTRSRSIGGTAAVVPPPSTVLIPSPVCRTARGGDAILGRAGSGTGPGPDPQRPDPRPVHQPRPSDPVDASGP
jgi:1-deoxy-D-xylulose-5-phosphate synthase